MDDSPGNLMNNVEHRCAPNFVDQFNIFRWHSTHLIRTVINPISGIYYVFFCCYENFRNRGSVVW
jgi:hypothetical protein